MVGIRGVVAALHDLHHMLQGEERLYFDHCCSCILTYSYVSRTRTQRRLALNMMEELSVLLLCIINQFQHQSVFYSSGSAPSYRDFNIIILHWNCSYMTVLWILYAPNVLAVRYYTVSVYYHSILYILTCTLY